MAPSTRPAVLSGFGNHFASEALPGVLPQGRNSPQRVARGLYAELLSGSAFTAPRADNRRSWLYRRQPSVVAGRPEACAFSRWVSGLPRDVATPPEPLRWPPFSLPQADAQVDFIEGLSTVCAGGDPDSGSGLSVHVVCANRGMGRRALVNADGEMLLVPQLGSLVVTTELGVLHAAPGQIVLVPRGLVFKVDLADAAAGPIRLYVAENHGAAFRLPELGPIGSNGLANPRDFEAPAAAFEPDPEPRPYELLRRFGGRTWRCTLAASPFNVVAWHGNLAPLRYDTAHFNTLGSISFDHPDPSIFTVLTSPSDTPGVANCDFVIFPPRWLVAEDSFRPPWFHRNLMSEFMGLVHGRYDAKPEGFLPGGASLHNSFVPHGPDTVAFERASQQALLPTKLEGTLAFMFESRHRLGLTAWAAQPALRDAAYADCWAGLADRFEPHGSAP